MSHELIVWKSRHDDMDKKRIEDEAAVLEQKAKELRSKAKKIGSRR